MKWTIERYGTEANVALDPDSRDHDLWTLWKQCKAIMLAMPTSNEDKPLEAVEQIVKASGRASLGIFSTARRPIAHII